MSKFSELMAEERVQKVVALLNAHSKKTYAVARSGKVVRVFAHDGNGVIALGASMAGVARQLYALEAYVKAENR